MNRNSITTSLVLVLMVMVGAVAWDVAAIVSRPLWPWLAWMSP